MNTIVRKLAKFIPTSAYISMKYFHRERRFPNLRKPKGFNEKLQWLKIHDKNPDYVSFVDKHEVKKYVAEKIGEQYVIPEYGVWESFDDIDFNNLPSSFVLKTTHDCGGIVLCKDMKTFDMIGAKEKLSRHLKDNYYYEGREWPYKNVKPRIIAEKMMVDEMVSDSQHFNQNADGLVDYKFYCFNGEPKFLYIAFANMINGEKHDLLSFRNLDWTPTEFYRKDHNPFPIDISKPMCFEEMIEISKKLSEGLPFIRVDLYCIDNRPFFSELTLTPGSGFGCFYPEKWEEIIGAWIDLGMVNKRK